MSKIYSALPRNPKGERLLWVSTILTPFPAENTRKSGPFKLENMPKHFLNPQTKLKLSENDFFEIVFP